MNFFFEQQQQQQQKYDGKMIFTNYWKGLVLNFPKMGNTVFFSLKS